MTPIGAADSAPLECLCRLTAQAAEPLLRRVPSGQHADAAANADPNDAVVRGRAMDFALRAWGALLRDMRAKTMVAAFCSGTLPAVRLSSADELLGPELLDAALPCGISIPQLRSLLLRVLGELVAQTKPDAAFIALPLPLSLSLDRATTARPFQA